jgi:hypothetical protein
MAFGSVTPFSKNPFTAKDPKLVKVPDAPETHEPPKRLRSYLVGASLSDSISTALSPLLPGAPRPSRKVEVERVRVVERAPSADMSLDE